MFDIKPTYSVLELSRLLKMDKARTKRTLTKLNIPMHKIGKGQILIIYLSEMQENAPRLFQSLLAVDECIAEQTINEDYLSEIDNQEIEEDNTEIRSKAWVKTIKFSK